MRVYRYERELNGGVRPPLRLIASKDSPASSPMVLCVSKITWSEGGITDGGVPILPFPQLEVTDGWYRMRVEVDEALARAVRRRVIRVGRKIAVVDARVCGPSMCIRPRTDILAAFVSPKRALRHTRSIRSNITKDFRKLVTSRPLARETRVPEKR